MERLAYRKGDRFAPIPPAEAGLQTVTAEHFLKVHDIRALHGEGTCFDKDGNLYFSMYGQGKVLISELWHRSCLGYIVVLLRTHYDPEHSVPGCGS